MNEQSTPDKPQLWYLRQQGEVRGPFNGSVIRRFAILGRVTLQDEVSDDAESWQPIAAVAEVVPPAIRESLERDDEQALLPARLREDERSGLERRSAASDELFKDRRAGERRREEPETLQRHRRARTALLRLGRERRLPLSRVVAAAVALALIIGFGVFYGDEPVSAEPDCRALPAAGVNWRNCRLEGLVAARQDLSGANMNNSVLRGADLSGALISHGDLRYADLGGVNLSYAQLEGVQLKGANLQNADLTYTDLGGADLSFADLRGANLGGAGLEGARFDEAVWFDGERCLPGSVGDCVKARPQTP